MSDRPTEGALILVVEDDPRVARFITQGLREEGMTVDWCEGGEAATQQGTQQPYDAVLLDWSLPGMDGVSLLRRWRAEGLEAPVIMLTARTGLEAMVMALDEGADDFIAKPFRFEELLARLRAHLRRSRRTPGAGAVMIGTCKVDLRRRVITRDEAEITLSAREFALLDLLLRHRGEVITRTRMLDQVWGLSHDPTTNVVDVYIRYLRSKLDPEGAALQDSCIETIRGRGYRLKAAP